MIDFLLTAEDAIQHGASHLQPTSVSRSKKKYIFPLTVVCAGGTIAFSLSDETVLSYLSSVVNMFERAGKKGKKIATTYSLNQTLPVKTKHALRDKEKSFLCKHRVW